MRAGQLTGLVIAALTLAGMATTGRAEGPGASDYRKEFGLWQVYCTANPKPDTPPCEVHQLLKNKEGQFVAGMFYTELGDRGIFMIRVTPALDDELKAGVLLQADTGFGTNAFKYMGCDQLGCLTQLPMKRVVVAILAKAHRLKVQIGGRGARPSTISFNLEGFPAALAHLRRHHD